MAMHVRLCLWMRLILRVFLWVIVVVLVATSVTDTVYYGVPVYSQSDPIPAANMNVGIVAFSMTCMLFFLMLSGEYYVDYASRKYNRR